MSLLLLATVTKINLNEHYVTLGVEIKENVLARHKFTNLLKSVSPGLLSLLDHWEMVSLLSCSWKEKVASYI